MGCLQVVLPMQATDYHHLSQLSEILQTTGTGLEHILEPVCGHYAVSTSPRFNACGLVDGRYLASFLHLEPGVQQSVVDATRQCSGARDLESLAVHYRRLIDRYQAMSL